MSNLLLINTPQYDYIENAPSVEDAKRVQHDILAHLLYDTEFMKDVEVAGIVLDFFPINNEHYDGTDTKDMLCLSFTRGASIDEDIAYNLHNLQECAIKKLPKNDNVRYEKSVLDNRDSGTFILELLGNSSSIMIDGVYICGFSVDGSIMSTLRMFSQFYPADRIHVIDDLIYCFDKNEKNEIDLFCLDTGIKQNNFTKFR